MSARRRRAGKDILIVYCLLKLTEKKGRKEMRRMKWLLAAVLSLALMFAMGSTVFAADGDSTELEITNNTGMFKAVTAYLTEESGQEYLVMALSGTGYKELFKGTYEMAVVNGDGSADPGNNTWIHGYTNSDGKIEFKIPLDADESYVPCVAVSNSYYEKYLSGQNVLDRAFYPRQFEVNREAKTLVTGDYEFNQQLAVTNNIKMMKDPTANLHTVGGPNSNNYASELTLTMQNDSYNEAFVGSYAEANAAENAISLDEANSFVVPVKWVETFGRPETLKTLTNGEPFYLSLKSKKNGNWFERIATIDEANGTLVLDESKADYTTVDEAIASIPEDLSPFTEETRTAVAEATDAVVEGKFASQQEEVDAMAAAINDAVAGLRYDKFVYEGSDFAVIKRDGSAFGMWTPQEGSTYSYSDGKIAIIIIPKNTTVYGWMHWGGINEELTKDVTLDDGKIILNLDSDMAGWAHPIAPIKIKDGATSKDQYYLAIPTLNHIEGAETFVAAQSAIAEAKADPTNKAKVIAALEAIDKLTDGEKERLAEDIAVVNAAKTAIENKEAAEAAIAAAKADPTNKAKVQAALAAIEKLTDAQKAALADDIKAVNDAKTAIDKAEKEAAGQAEAAKVKAMKITLKKATAGKKKVTVSWTKNTGVEGYEVYYKTGKKVKTVKITKNSTTKKVIKKLKKGKKYTVKVRGYKKVNGQMVYTKWSKAKKAKVK